MKKSIAMQIAVMVMAVMLMASRVDAQTADPAVRLTVIHAGLLIAVPGEAPRPNQSIVVRGNRIESIQPGFVTPPDATVIDLSQATVLPGLIDCHVHLTLTPAGRKTQSPLTQSDADYAVIALENAAKTLAAGFTTVRDLGARSRAIYTVRDAIAKGTFIGPTIVAAGRMVSVTGGHGDAAGFTDGALEVLASSAVCDGPYDCRRAVRAQIRDGADVIKIATTGGGGEENGTELSPPEMFDDEIEAAVKAAHDLGRKVAVHAHGTAGINAALRAGADSIEHGGFVNEESIRLMKRNGAVLVPTLSVLADVEAGLPKADPRRLPMMRNFLAKMPLNVGAAYRAGISIVFGTDAGVNEHGTNASEFLWHAKIGMSPEDSLRSATVNAARLLGKEAEIGTIEAGKLADIIATPGNPLQDPAVLGKPQFVMKSGQVVELRGRNGAVAMQVR